MSPYYLDRDLRYHTAASHANAGAFARRQQQRRREAQEPAKPAPVSNVKQMKRRQA